MTSSKMPHPITADMVSPSTNVNPLVGKELLSPEDMLLLNDVDDLLQALEIVCDEFVDSVLTSRIKHCVAAHYAKLRGSAIIKVLVPYAQSSKEANKAVGNIFRNRLEKIYEHSGVLSQSFRKPYGNPGDFSLLELVYDESAHPCSPTAVGRAIDLWTVRSGLATAVVDRKNALRLFIENMANTYKASGRRVSVLSIASGAARELRELPQPAIENLDVTLLDIDARGMAFAKAHFDTRHYLANVNTFVADALADETAVALSSQNPCDLVYSFGLYDYLNDQQLLKSISVALHALKDEGTFVFCLKDHRFFDAWLYDWVMNWRFYPRVIEDGFVLAEKAGLTVEEVHTVEGKAVNMFVCKRR